MNSVPYKLPMLSSYFSLASFIEKILSAKIDVSDSPIKIIKINKKIEFSDGDRFISIEPSTLSLEIDFELKYKNQIIGNQNNKVKVYEDDLRDIYNSRTYCLFEDIELIKKNGLGKGGSLDNAIVVKENQILTVKEICRKNMIKGKCIMSHLIASDEKTI